MRDNLKKRCACPRRQWTKCSHPWHFSFKFKGRDYRYSLHRAENKPADYVMSKTEALGVADRLRNEIRDGKPVVDPSTAPPAVLTFGDIADRYIKGHVNRPERRQSAAVEMARQIRQLRETVLPGPAGSEVRLEDKPITSIIKADVDAFRDGRRAVFAASQTALDAMTEERAAHPGMPIAADLETASRLAVRSRKAGEVATNRLLQRFKHLFTWAIGEGYVTETPFARHGVTVIKPNQAVERARGRRLVGDEEQRLLAAAGPTLQALILAALETGCRKGELLSLQWKQVDLDAGTIFLPAEKTKTAEDRTIPITARLRAVLAMRRTDPAGEDFGPEAFVFGNEVGEEQDSIKSAWPRICQRAGITDLHFHDLRRECGSRLIETPGISLVDVRDWLGHLKVDTTNRYLSTTVARLQAAGRKVDQARKRAESGKKRTNGAHSATHAPTADTVSEAVDGPNVLH